MNHAAEGRGELVWQTEPTTSQDLEMLEKAVGGARTAGIADDDAGLQSLLLHVSKLRVQLGLGDRIDPTEAAGKAADKQPSSGTTTRVADTAEANASAEALESAEGGAGGDFSCVAKGSCAAEGGSAQGSDAADSAATEATAHGGAADDDLPALDLYADEDGASKKRKRRRRKRK